MVDIFNLLAFWMQSKFETRIIWRLAGIFYLPMIRSNSWCKKLHLSSKSSSTIHPSATSFTHTKIPRQENMKSKVWEQKINKDKKEWSKVIINMLHVFAGCRESTIVQDWLYVEFTTFIDIIFLVINLKLFIISK